MQEDEKFLSEVFAQLTDEATDDDKRRELVSYLFLKFEPLKNTYLLAYTAFNIEFVKRIFYKYEMKDTYLYFIIIL